jgi:hypothetical protein
MKVYGIALAFISLSSAAFSAVPAQNSVTVRPPASGSKSLTMKEVPAYIRHSAEAALGSVTKSFSISSAQLDLDDVLAIYEIEARTEDGRRVEVDVEPSGRIEEIEVEVSRDEVPAVVMEAFTKTVSNFQPADGEVLYEKSLRPAKNGLLEVWYEFSGKTFDVEIRNDGQSILIEPA